MTILLKESKEASTAFFLLLWCAGTWWGGWGGGVCKRYTSGFWGQCYFYGLLLMHFNNWTSDLIGDQLNLLLYVGTIMKYKRPYFTTALVLPFCLNIVFRLKFRYFPWGDEKCKTHQIRLVDLVMKETISLPAANPRPQRKNKQTEVLCIDGVHFKLGSREINCMESDISGTVFPQKAKLWWCLGLEEASNIGEIFILLHAFSLWTGNTYLIPSNIRYRPNFLLLNLRKKTPVK